MNFSEYLADCKGRVDSALQSLIDDYPKHRSKLLDAMAYSLLNGGKRVRPVLVYAAADDSAVPNDWADAAAMAIECIHCYSLIHDDLPAMDDDDLRRGKPTCHIQFDEATAILAGDALQTLAFEILSNAPWPAELAIKQIKILSKASGAQGMAVGQAIDLESTGMQLDIQQLKGMHNAKTGALITAAVEMGMACRHQANPEDFEHIRRYGALIGLAFQVQDDILDITSDTETLGKPQGSDLASNKATYPALLGLEGAQRTLNELHAEAVQCLEKVSQDTHKLKSMADYLITRVN